MKSNILFWLLAGLVFGFMAFCGFQFHETNINLFYLLEGFTLLALVLFILLHRRFIRPYKIITESTEVLKEQDFSTRLRPVADSEANKLIAIFNRMMDSLREERTKVREKNHFLDLLIQASPQGVIILDFDDYITDINPAGMRFLNIADKSALLGKKIKDTHINISKALSELEVNDDIIIRNSGITAYRCIRSSFIDKGFNHPFILIEELTEELLKAERKSYEGVIRMIAHEVNNSTGAIGSTLNVISDMLKENDIKDILDVLPAVDASLERCRNLGRFVSNFAEVIKLPEPHKTDVDLNELVKSAEALTQIECRRRNIRLTTMLSGKKRMAQLDAMQLEQVLVNIIKNAYEAIEENGEIQIITALQPLSIVIRNNDPEIPGNVRNHLFSPFFTTKVSGQGIGLIFTREVLFNHQASFSLYSDNGWTVFRIIFNN